MRYRLPLAVLLLLLLAGCAGGLSRGREQAGCISPAAAVERFLQLASDRSYLEMGWVFGTEEGPVLDRWPRPEVEQRMYALANVLQHDAFVVGNGTPVPGRVGKAIRFQVTLQRGSRQVQVPIVAVQGPRGRWLVEQVDVEALTDIA